MSFSLSIKTAEDLAAEAAAQRRALVDAERERRLALGATIAVTGYGDIPVQGRERDMVVFANLRLSAMELKAAQVTAPVLPFRDRENGMHQLSADQMLELISKAVAAGQAIYAAAWAIKDSDPVPDDVTADALWPKI